MTIPDQIAAIKERHEDYRPLSFRNCDGGELILSGMNHEENPTARNWLLTIRLLQSIFHGQFRTIPST